MHTVEGAQHRGLATAGRADEGRHRARRDMKVNVLNGVEIAVVDIEIFEIKLLSHLRDFLLLLH